MHILNNNIRTFIHEHDRMPAFHAGYLVVTFLIAALFNLGMFALVIIAHMTLDYVKYTELYGYSRRNTWKAMLSESSIDIVLLLIGFVFAVYLHHGVEMAAVSGLVRAAVTLARGLGTVIPKLEILYRFVDTLMNPQEHMQHVQETVRARWTFSFACMIFLGGVCVLLLILAPVILTLDGALLEKVLMDQMIPWNF